MTTRWGTEPPQDRPWWLLALALAALWLGWRIWADAALAQVAQVLFRGLGVTLFVSLVAFGLACLLGLGLALAVLSRRALLRQVARAWIELLRGLPILVLLLYVAFVIAPALVEGVNLLRGALGLDPLRSRDFPLLWRAILALVLGYSAFLAEVFRAGLQSVPRGQIEAAESLGLGPWLRFRLIVAPQALRTILPPLGNDFIAMVKDSSLVSVLGVADITQLGKVLAAGNFRYFETYNIVALFYLCLTVGLSVGLQRLEARLRRR